MPSNGTNRIQIIHDVVALSIYAFSTQDDLAVLAQIPSGGTVITLPSNPNAGDEYAFADGDGSCSSANPITLTAGAGTTIQGLGAIAFSAPFSAGTVQYSERLQSWVLKASSSIQIAGSKLVLLQTTQVPLPGSTLAPGQSETVASLANGLGANVPILVQYDLNVGNDDTGAAVCNVNVIAYGDTLYQQSSSLLTSSASTVVNLNGNKVVAVQSGTRGLSVQLANSNTSNGSISLYEPGDSILGSIVNFYAIGS